LMILNKSKGPHDLFFAEISKSGRQDQQPFHGHGD